jgi:dolichol-phosphate mannosyltransferase
MDLSVVIPVYQAEGCLRELHARLVRVLEGMSIQFEILFVEDRSRDASWRVIRELAADPRVKAIRFSRNFGQHSGITAGLAESAGRHVVVMDCDLQDDPADIPRLYQEAKKGTDVVYTVKEIRAHSRLRNAAARVFTSVFNRLAGGTPANQETRLDVGSFSMISRPVVDAFRQVRDADRHYLMILRWLGFSSAYVPVKHQPRFSGKSSYTWSRLLRHAVSGVVSQSDRPLSWSIAVGGVYLFASLALFLAAAAWLLLGGSVSPWWIMIAVVFLCTGSILASLGVVGLYVARMFEQTRNRPLYVIDQRLNC